MSQKIVVSAGLILVILGACSNIYRRIRYGDRDKTQGHAIMRIGFLIAIIGVTL